jgi:hypothetical protein
MAKRLFEVGAAGEAGAEDALGDEMAKVGVGVGEGGNLDREGFTHAGGEQRDLIGERQVVGELVLVLEEVPLPRAEKDGPLLRRNLGRVRRACA